MATKLPTVHLLDLEDIRIGDTMLLSGPDRVLYGRHVFYLDGQWREGRPREVLQRTVVATTTFDIFQDRLFNFEAYRFQGVPLQYELTDEGDDMMPAVHTTTPSIKRKISKETRVLKLIGQDDLDDVDLNINHLGLRTCFQFLHPGKQVLLEDKRGARKDIITSIGVGIRGPLAVALLSDPELWIGLMDVKLTFEHKQSIEFPMRPTVTVDHLQEPVLN